MGLTISNMPAATALGGNDLFELSQGTEQRTSRKVTLGQLAEWLGDNLEIEVQGGTAGKAVLSSESAADALLALGAAPAYSPAFSGQPTAPTPQETAEGEEVANAEFVKTAIANAIAAGGGGGSGSGLSVGDVLQTLRTLSAPEWLALDGGTYAPSLYPALAAAMGIANGPPTTLVGGNSVYTLSTQKSALSSHATISPDGNCQILAIPHDDGYPFTVLKKNPDGTVTSIHGSDISGAPSTAAWKPDGSGFYVGTLNGKIHDFTFDPITEVITHHTDEDGYWVSGSSAIHSLALDETGEYMAVAVKQFDAGLRMLRVNGLNDFTELTCVLGNDDTYNINTTETHQVLYVGAGAFWFVGTSINHAAIGENGSNFVLSAIPSTVSASYNDDSIKLTVNSTYTKAYYTSDHDGGQGLWEFTLTGDRKPWTLAAPSRVVSRSDMSRLSFTTDEAHLAVGLHESPWLVLYKASDFSLVSPGITELTKSPRSIHKTLDNRLIVCSLTGSTYSYSVFEGAPGSIVLPNDPGTGGIKKYVKAS